MSVELEVRALNIGDPVKVRVIAQGEGGLGVPGWVPARVVDFGRATIGVEMDNGVHERIPWREYPTRIAPMVDKRMASTRREFEKLPMPPLADMEPFLDRIAGADETRRDAIHEEIRERGTRWAAGEIDRLRRELVRERGKSAAAGLAAMRGEGK